MPPGRGLVYPVGPERRQWLISARVDTVAAMRTVFPTKELRDEAVEKYHAIEGGQQTLSNLATHVTEIVRKEAKG